MAAVATSGIAVQSFQVVVIIGCIMSWREADLLGLAKRPGRLQPAGAGGTPGARH
jgi:hypothetical protein